MNTAQPVNKEQVDIHIWYRQWSN